MSDLAATFSATAAEATRLAAPRSADTRRESAPATAQVFPGLLDKAMDAAATIEDRLHDASQKLISTAFIMPMFSQLRSDPLAANLFHGGQAEKAFQQQLDQVLSDRISQSTNFDLVDAVYNQLAKALPGAEVDTRG